MPDSKMSGIITYMNEDRGQNNGEKSPNILWGILIALWTIAVYVLFFTNFIRDFMGSKGG
ncbi:MAG: hypothetical protein NTY09_04030 [bacterium]|nr:hypothetical protein [bacterium]